MVDDIHVSVDAAKAKALLRGLNASTMTKVWRRTLKKTSRWLAAKAAREINKEVHFAIKVIKARLRYFEKGLDEGKLWAGFNPMDSSRLGKARQSAGGVSVGKYQFPGAWIKKHHANRGAFMRAGQARFPIVKQTVKWDQAATQAFTALVTEVEARLLALLEHEIDYELSRL